MIEPLSRRMFIRRFSSGSLAVAALGMAAFACAEDEPAATTAPSTGGDASSTTEPTSPSTTRTPSTTSAPETTTAVPAGTGTWERVELGFVSAYVVAREGEAAVIDTGGEGSGNDIEQTLAAVGATWNDVGHVILTHLHGDHIGSLAAVMAAAADATAYAHAADIPGIPSPRPISPVVDADTIFGLTVVHTPGHTAGHIALLEPSLSVLFAGDALNGANPGVSGPNPRFTPDMPLAIESARRLGTFDYDTVVFGHGEPVFGEASSAVGAMAANL